MARILITSAIPYINGIKHLGNLAGSMLHADVYARFQRGRGEPVGHQCGCAEVERLVRVPQRQVQVGLPGVARVRAGCQR